MSRLDLPIHVESRGRGRPLIFLHGFGANSFTWRHWAGPLAQRYEVLLVDLKGWGASPAPRDGRYGPHDNAELIHHLIRQRGLEEVTLVGHSYGGGVALLTALRLLDEGAGRLARIVSVAGAAYRQKIPRFISMARHHFAGELALRIAPTKWLVRKILREITFAGEAESETQVNVYADPISRPGTRYAIMQAADQLLPPDLDTVERRYAELDVPALLLWGREDPVIPISVAERLQRELPDARLVVLEECGHLVPEEKPRESFRALAAFLKETD